MAISKKDVTLDGLKYTAGEEHRLAAQVVAENANTFTETNTFTKGQQSSAQAVTATSDGLTTGIIPTGATYVTVTSAGANNIVLLPPPTPGTVVWVHVTANGCEVRAGSATGTDASDTISIGGNSASSGHESALAANRHMNKVIKNKI